jgi:hypothetical protein
MVVIACHTPPYPKEYRHFLTCMGLERLGTSAYPFRCISLVGFLLWARTSERASFCFSLGFFWDTTAITASSVASLFSFYSQPHHGRILGRVSDCIYSREGRHTGDLVFLFGLRRRCSNATPNLGRDRGQRHPPSVFSLFFLGWNPCGNKALGWLVIMISPCVCPRRWTHRVLSLHSLSPFVFLVLRIMFTAFTKPDLICDELSDETGACRLPSSTLDDDTPPPPDEPDTKSHIGDTGE